MRKENSSKYKSKIKPLVIKLNNFTTFTFYILRKNAFKRILTINGVEYI